MLSDLNSASVATELTDAGHGILWQRGHTKFSNLQSEELRMMLAPAEKLAHPKLMAAREDVDPS